MQKCNSILLFFLLALSCAVRPPPAPEASRVTILSLVNNAALDSMQGSGSVVFGQNGEQVAVSFDIRWSGDSSFSAEFSTAFGMSVASIRSKAPGTWSIEAGDTRYDVRPDQAVQVGQDFLRYPVSWEEFLSVITGRLLCVSVFSSAPDSQYVDKMNSVLVWKARRCCGQAIDIVGKIDNKTHSLSELLYIGKAADGWTLTAGNFKDGRAKEFRFVQSNNNYFYVKYHSMKFHPAAGKRKAS